MEQDWLISSLKFIRLNLGILLISLGIFIVLIWGGVQFINSFSNNTSSETELISPTEGTISENISATSTVVPTSSPEPAIPAAPAAMNAPTPPTAPAAPQDPTAATVAPSSTPAATPTLRIATATAKPQATARPTTRPTPSATPKPILTQLPTSTPTVRPTPTPTAIPTVKPTAVPTPVATPKPTIAPTATPTMTPQPTQAPVATTKGGLPLDGSNGSAVTAPPQNTGSYTVQKGDSTWKVAVKFYGNGYRYVEIEKANNLKHNQHLSIGQVLTIPDKQITGSVGTPAKDSGKVTTQPGQTAVVGQPQSSGKTYTVKAGDSLWSIAQQQLGNAYRWNEVYTLNTSVVGRNPHLIYPGQSLALPITSQATSPNPPTSPGSN